MPRWRGAKGRFTGWTAEPSASGKTSIIKNAKGEIVGRYTEGESRAAAQKRFERNERRLGRERVQRTESKARSNVPSYVEQEPTNRVRPTQHKRPQQGPKGKTLGDITAELNRERRARFGRNVAMIRADAIVGKAIKGGMGTDTVWINSETWGMVAETDMERTLMGISAVNGSDKMQLVNAFRDLSPEEQGQFMDWFLETDWGEFWEEKYRLDHDYGAMSDVYSEMLTRLKVPGVVR